MSVKNVALSIVTLLIILRAVCEYSMMSAYGPDAQMGIWFVFLVVQLLFWLVTGVIVAVLLIRAWPDRWRSLAVIGLFLVWATAVCWSSFRYYKARLALVDASLATTSPQRLRELAGFDGIQAGYELDNRIASNPNTPPEVLRSLHGRADQVGTEMCLARNPNTPDDILHELANRNDDWSQYITDSLKQNPKYNEVFGNRE
jgi:hypothetical protein